MLLKRIDKISVFFTSILVLLTWGIFNSFDTNLIKNETLKVILNSILQVVLSYGYFEILQDVITNVIAKHNKLKKILFAENYIEGYWVGYYIKIINNEKVIKLCIEKIEQTTDNILVTGKSYDLNFKLYATWTTSGHPAKVIDNRLQFIFTNDLINETPSTTLGISSFQLSKTTISKNPGKIEGYSYNVYNANGPNKSVTLEMKVAELSSKETDIEFLAKAKDIYLQNYNNATDEEIIESEELPA